LCEICSIDNQEIQKAYKALRLNGGSYYPIGLLGASKKKPTLWIKRLKSKSGFHHSPYNTTRLRSASSSNSSFISDGKEYVRPDADGIVRIRGEALKKIKQWQELEKENAEKALSLNCGF
jgi:hypothetical protein